MRPDDPRRPVPANYRGRFGKADGGVEGAMVSHSLRRTSWAKSCALAVLFCAGTLADADAAPLERADAFQVEQGAQNDGSPDRQKETFAFAAGFKLDYFSNRGAGGSGNRPVSHLDVRLEMDLERIFGWPATSATINLIGDGGSGQNARHVGSLMGVSNIEVGAPITARVFQAWVQRKACDDRLSVRVGIYPIDTEFFAMESAAVLIGPQYGTPADLAMTRGPSIFNNAAFGGRIRWEFDNAAYLMAAVLDGIPNDPNHPKRSAIRFGHGDGVFYIGEFGVLPRADNHVGHAKFAVGLWGYGTRVDDQFATDASGTPRKHRQQGGYVLGEHTLLQWGGEDGRFVSGFARYTWSDGRSTPLANSVNLGLHGHGVLSDRPDDVLAVAVTRVGTSGQWRALQSVAFGQTPRRSEVALEVTYRIGVSPQLAIQPNLQRIRNPGGLGGVADAKLAGVRPELTL